MCADTVSQSKLWDLQDSAAVWAECKTRDSLCLCTGKEPELRFETEDLEKEIRTRRPHEIVTANRLRKHGIDTYFQKDEIKYTDPTTGLEQTIGLPGFKNGIEIITLFKRVQYSTLVDYTRGAKHK